MLLKIDWLLSAEVLDQSDQWDRFAVILYNNSERQFVFSARRWNNNASAYICQQGMSIIPSDSTECGLSMFYYLSNDHCVNNSYKKLG